MHPLIALGPVSVSTYFLIISCASTVGLLWFLRRARLKKMSQVRAIDFALVGLVSGFIGARGLHVFFEEPEYYLSHPLRVLAIWSGGYVFFGGLIGAWVCLTLYCQWRKEPLFVWLDLSAIPLAFTYAIGRVACFFNGCCFGRHCELPWAVVMAGDRRHPVQLYATLIELAPVVFLLQRERTPRTAGVIFANWLVLHGLGRIVMEYFRDDPRGPAIAGLSLGTWLGLTLALAGTGLLVTLPKTARN